MGLEWRGPHVTIPVCLLHYVWIPKLNVYRDGSYQAPQVPQYYGTPQTKPGVTKNDRENNFTRTIWTGYSAEYLKCKTIQGIGQYIRQNIIEVLWWVVSTTTQECNSFDKHHNMLLHSSEIIKIFFEKYSIQYFECDFSNSFPWFSLRYWSRRPSSFCG